MELILYTANCTGAAGNCLYPNKRVIRDAAGLADAVRYDQVFARYKNDYRSIKNFLEASVIPQDVDNDSDDPASWLSAEDLLRIFADVDCVIIPSRHHMRPKGGKAPRPRLHVLFPCRTYTDAAAYTAAKAALQRRYPFFDQNAQDAARFFFGSKLSAAEVVWHEGGLRIDETLSDLSTDVRPAAERAGTHCGPIEEGSRNNTMCHFAARVLKRFGPGEQAEQAYRERARQCRPPLEEAELSAIWKSALRFYERISAEEGYVKPEEYHEEPEPGSLKPEDFSDIGEAKVLARSCSAMLRYTSATDFITFHKDRWYEDNTRALGTVLAFLDAQLADAEAAVSRAEARLSDLGIDGATVRERGKTLEKMIPEGHSPLLQALNAADAYRRFVMKYRNYKNIVAAQNAAKPMLALDVSELDYDAELLNTPAGTYDLTRGMAGGRPHDPDDLITKITACGPGEQGRELWLDALRLFFCQDEDLIAYVQEIVGMVAVGRVYGEHLIMAYGGGANGKSTFWNTIARVLGTYSGRLSAEALTMSCRRNVKPEMAELKGKRLVIASELEEGTRLNTGMVKQLCSVDPIEAEKKYKDPFHFDPSHTIVLYTNHLPKVSANDDGTWRRLIVIPFNAKITGRKDIKNYSEYLFQKAGPAIMQWIIEGAERAIAQGFQFRTPAAVETAIAAYRENNDWLGQFIEEYCERGEGYEAKSGELYQCYRESCLRNGEYIRNTTDFYSSLEQAGFKRRRTNKSRVVAGLRLRSGLDLPD